jgi:DNA invertase Pin-like site-specific DNA recombinase
MEKNNMNTFSRVKNKIQKYKEEITRLEESVIKENGVLRTEIIKYWMETKFLSVKFEDGNREYYYLSNFDLIDENYFYGVKLSKDGKFDIGKISFSPIMLATQYETINADKFFGKLKSLDISIDGLDNPIAKELNCFKPIVTHCYEDKKDVVGYCRLSQNNKCKNLFDRQVSLIKNFVNNIDECHMVEFFKEIVSGKTHLNKRPIISDLIEYCSCHDIHTIAVSELNRLGRTKEVILASISYLNKHGISEIYVIKESILINEEFITNHYRQLNSLAKSCEDEYENIKYRMREGYNAYIEKRKEAIENGDINTYKLGRQGYVKDKNAYLKQYGKEIDLMFNSKMSLRQVKTVTGTSLGTLMKLKNMFKDDMYVGC